MSTYDIALLVVALALLGAVVLPRLVTDKPLSFPMLYVGFGFLLFWLAPVPAIDPVANATVTEHLTELVVIIALMGVGLKIDRPFGVDNWVATWRLIGITMPLSIAGVALAGWWLLGLHPATAILLGLGFLLVIRPPAGIVGFLGSSSRGSESGASARFSISPMRWPSRRLPNSNCWSPPNCCGPSSASSSSHPSCSTVRPRVR